MEYKVLVVFTDQSISSYKPSEEWKTQILNKLNGLDFVVLEKTFLSRKLLRTTINTQDFEYACNEINNTLGENNYIRIYQEGESFALYYSKQKSTINRIDCFAKGYPILHCGLTIAKEACKDNLTETDIKKTLIDMGCNNICVQFFNTGLKVFFDKSSIIYENFINNLCDSLKINYFGLFLDQKDSSFRDAFMYDYIIIDKPKTYYDFSGDDSSLDNRFW